MGVIARKRHGLLNPNREAGLLEVPRRGMLAPEGHHQSSCIKISTAGRSLTQLSWPCQAQLDISSVERVKN